MRKLWGLLLFLLLCGCAALSGEESPRSVPDSPPTASGGEPEFHSDTVWCVYWDAEVSQALAEGDWTEAVLFACYYDERDSLYVPPQLEKLRDTVEDAFGGKRYFSVVNDVQLSDGTAVQKDPLLLERLFESTEGMERRIGELLSLAEDWGCSGLEIDYEGLTGEGIWDRYAQFLRLLWLRAQERELSLRVVLPCNAPVDRVALPEGPRYVVMCYNLCGYHSGPGPKADLAFLRDIAKRFSGLPNISYALSNGGFDWDASGNVCAALTEAAAKRLEEGGSGLRRDPESQALTFTYSGEDGAHTVWYANRETLAAWAQALAGEAGGPVSVNLWRLESGR